jgi:hypothetical protein
MRAGKGSWFCKNSTSYYGKGAVVSPFSYLRLLPIALRGLQHKLGHVFRILV